MSDQQPRISGYCQHNWLDLSKPCQECGSEEVNTLKDTLLQAAVKVNGLEHELAVANAEVERLKAQIHNLCHDKHEAGPISPQDFCIGCEEFQVKLFGESPITELREQNTLLLANSKALANAIAQAPHHRMCNFMSAKHIDTCNCWKSTARVSHDKLMEQLSPTAAGSGMGG